MAAIAMADNNFKTPEKEQEEENARIPVLTVIKNNTILKNIFIILNDENEHTFLVGRHPHCNIVLTHPSISRFHLKIRSAPSSRTLSLVDLASVHGTWVCGKKLEPGVTVELKEGDTFALGISTRVYRLCWVPLSSEFDSEHPFFSQLDLVMPQLDEEEEMIKDMKPDENLEFSAAQETLMHDEEKTSQTKHEMSGVLNGSSGTETSCFPANSDGTKEPCGCQNRVLCPPYVQSIDGVDHTKKIKACPEVVMLEETSLLCTLRECWTQNICLPVVESVQSPKMQQFQSHADTFTAQPPSSEMHSSSLLTNVDPAPFDQNGEAAVDALPKESEFGCTPRDCHKSEDISTTGKMISKSEDTRSLIGEDIPDSKFHHIKVVEEVSVNSLSDGEKQDECSKEHNLKLQDLNAKSIHEQGNSLDDHHIKVVEEVSVNLLSDGARRDECIEEHNSRLQDLNAKSIHEQGNSLDEIVEDITDSKFHQINVIEEVSVDLLSDGEKRDECSEEQHNSKLQDLNAKSIHEQGNSQCEIVDGIGNKCVKNIDPESFDENGAAALAMIPKESEFGCTLKHNDKIEDIITMEARIINAENTSLLEEEALVNKFQQVKIVDEAAVDSISDKEIEDKAGKKLNPKLQAYLKDRSPDDIVEDTGNKSLNSMPQEAPLNITSKIENRSPQFLNAVSGRSGMKILESRVEPTEKSSIFGKMRSRTSTAASAPQVRTKKSRLMSAANINTEVKNRHVKSMPKNLCNVFDDEKVIPVPNKENLSPNTLWFVRQRGKLEDVEHFKLLRSHSLKVNFSPNICSAESMGAISIKENKFLKVVQEWNSQRKPLGCHMKMAHEQDTMELKHNRVDRAPFQSPMNSGSNLKSGTSCPVSVSKSSDDASNSGQISDKQTRHSHVSGEQKRNWVMVVDTASVLNKESRKALQLLQGLKGTSLVIPGLVIKELSNMKQQYRIFRRTSEASLALEWIEECTKNTKWWIHIQSSMEECSKELASPTVEDHILDCALAYRTKKNIGQLVLLSEDVSLKVKSMAKGLLCETAQKFRHSLVNPFSERFMWPNSSPRGLNWSWQDDVFLRENYCGLPSKAGLKLITEQLL